MDDLRAIMEKGNEDVTFGASGNQETEVSRTVAGPPLPASFSVGIHRDGLRLR